MYETFEENNVMERSVIRSSLPRCSIAFSTTAASLQSGVTATDYARKSAATFLQNAAATLEQENI